VLCLPRLPPCVHEQADEAQTHRQHDRTTRLSGIGFTTTQHIPTLDERYDVIFFLDEKHRTVIMEEIIIRWVAGMAVGVELYGHTTAQQTLAVAMLPDAAQAHWISDNAVVRDETRRPNTDNGAIKGTQPS
jgi:hypothetical protein